jgi:hypothetical protein
LSRVFGRDSNFGTFAEGKKARRWSLLPRKGAPPPRLRSDRDARSPRLPRGRRARARGPGGVPRAVRRGRVRLRRRRAGPRARAGHAQAPPRFLRAPADVLVPHLRARQRRRGAHDRGRGVSKHRGPGGAVRGVARRAGRRAAASRDARAIHLEHSNRMRRAARRARRPGARARLRQQRRRRVVGAAVSARARRLG